MLGTSVQADSTVFIVDDDEACRNSFVFLLRSEGLRCRAFPSAGAFLKVLDAPVAGCVVSDLKMPEMDGIALACRLKEVGCRMPVILITGHGDVDAAVRAMKNGAADFIEKPFRSETVLTSIRECLGAAAQIEAVAEERASLDLRRQRLTKREAEVLDHLVRGCSNKDIANALGLSSRTVEVYRLNLMTKMLAENVADLMRMAFLLKDGRAAH